ncbi:TonB-dependent receptor [Apibacter mensalis]|uniref:TonB-dependent receptor domain-containing protein n=1 Tax=Apibacter mensalis TaxID=1586267 RepID=UPI0026EFB841|nr:TonB-dependent receptor [Apibacter mensalis]
MTSSKSILSTFCLVLYTFIFSQNIVITGTIITDNNRPVPYSSITLTNLEDTSKVFGGLADEKGKFSVKVTPGEYELVIDQAGFDSYVDQKSLLQSTSLGNIKIEQTAKELEGIVVEGKKPLYKVELDKKIYDVSQDLTAKSGTLSDVMQNVPSVTVDVDGTVSLRGNDNVKILVDGKPSAMLGINDTAEALKSIPADMVEKIEVVTNASARYESSGTAGIINIITKKNRKKGVTGSIQMSGGSPQSYGTSINLGYGKKKWNWFTNIGFRYGKNKGKEKKNYIGYDMNHLMDENSLQDSKRNRERTSLNASTGFNFTFDEQNSLSTSVGYNYNTSNYLSTTHYNTTLYPSLIQSFTERKERENRNNYGIDGNLNFTHNFFKKGNVLTVDGFYSYNLKDSDSKIFDRIPGLNTNDNTQTKIMLKSDYVLPFKEGSQLEAGMRADYSKIKSDFSLNEFKNNSWVVNPDQTDNTVYQENILSSYLQYGNKWGGFSFLAGLREETSIIKVVSRQANSTITKNYTDLFPTLHLNYDLTEKSQLQISYSRRIFRPDSRMLIPYKNISDDRNTRQGNPDLDPSYINSFELGYNLQQSNWGITPSLYYQRTQDPLQFITTSDPLGNLNTMPTNLGHENRYGGELSYSVNPYKWWKIFGDVNLFQYESYGNYSYEKINTITGSTTLVTENLDKKGFTWRTRMSMTVKLPENFNFQLQGNYMAPFKNGQNKSKEMYGMDLGISKDILKGQGTFLFNIQDVFDSKKRKFKTYGDDFYRYSEMQWRPRQFTLSFTYRFNNSNDKRGNNKKNRQQNNTDTNSDFDDINM